MTRIHLLLVASATLAACADEGGLGEANAPLRPDPLLFSVSADQDGDGIADSEEIRGWTIRVDQTAVPDGIKVREVWSDPTLADTDGDGLDDYAERKAGSDPRSPDTDGDGLGDAAEVLRWGTNPTSVDTDRDAGGVARASPLPAYFDGAELALRADPLNPGGPKIPGPGATSPLLPDSDGDGVWDYDEAIGRRAAIAEMPLITVRSDPSSRASFALMQTITDGETRSVETSLDLSYGASQTSSFSNTTTFGFAAWVTATSDAAVKLDAGVDLEHGGVQGGGRLAVGVGAGASEQISNVTTFSLDWVASFAQTRTEIEREERSRTQTIEGASLTLSVLVENHGRVSGRITHLSVAASYLDLGMWGSRSITRPLATLLPIDGDFDHVLRPGERISVQLRASDISAARARAFMAAPGHLVLSPANYSVLTVGDADVAFGAEVLQARTTTLIVQGRGDAPELLRIATTIDRTADGRLAGASLAELLDQAGLAWSLADVTRDGATQQVLNVGSDPTRFHQGEPPNLGDPPYPDGIAPGPRLLEQGWTALAVSYRGVPSLPVRDFRSARYFPGDSVTLTLTGDRDRDGISTLEERMRGTSDVAIDTDGDGLSDFYEMRVPFAVSVAGQPTYTVFASPSLPDSDGDGLNDRVELDAGTDPTRADTDGDRVGDAQELDDPTRSPLAYEGPSVTVSCSKQLVGELWHHTMSADNHIGDLAEVRITWSSGKRVVIPFDKPRGAWGATFLDSTASVTTLSAVDTHGNVTSTESCACVPESPAEFCDSHGAQCGMTFGTNRCNQRVNVDCGKKACGANPTRANPEGPSGSASVCYDLGYIKYLRGLHSAGGGERVTNRCAAPSEWHYCPNGQTNCPMWCPSADAGVPNTGGCP